MIPDLTKLFKLPYRRVVREINNLFLTRCLLVGEEVFIGHFKIDTFRVHVYFLVQIEIGQKEIVFEVTCKRFLNPFSSKLNYYDYYAKMILEKKLSPSAITLLCSITEFESKAIPIMILSKSYILYISGAYL